MKDKIINVLIGVVIGFTLALLMIQYGKADNQSTSSTADSVSKTDTLTLGTFYTIDAVHVQYKVVKPVEFDEMDIKIDLAEMTSKHTAEWLYKFGRDSIQPTNYEIIFYQFDVEFQAYIQERIRVNREFERAKAELEFAKLKAEIEKQMVDHLVDSANNVKK